MHVPAGQASPPHKVTFRVPQYRAQLVKTSCIKKIRAKKLHVSILVDTRRALYLSLERRGLLGEALARKLSGPSRSHSCRDFPAKVYTRRMRRRET